MKYEKLPEPHRSLLFKLVEVYRKRAEPFSGLIPFYEDGLGIVLYLEPDGIEYRPGMTREHLELLDEYDYIDPLGLDRPSSRWRIAVTQQALDYYNYMHYPAWRRWLSDVWDKTEKYWLSLLFGLLGGFLGGWLAWLSRNWLWQK